MAFLSELSEAVASLLVAKTVVALGALYLVALAVYRLYLHPLACFPGPKLAALTQWYEFYWNVILPGQFTFHLQDLHDRYGPIIRINPWEVHIRDPAFYETIYSNESKRDKVAAHAGWADTGGAAQATVDHDLHRLRRGAQDPYFSKRQILAFSPYIQGCADRLVTRLADEYAGSDRLVCLSDAYGCFTGDIVMEYCFARNYSFLDRPDFFSPFLLALNHLESTFHIMVHFPWILPILKALPDSLLPAAFMPVIEFERDMTQQIQDLMNDRNQGYKDAAHPTVFKELLDSNLPPAEKSVRRLKDEGVTLIGAGQETTKVALQVGTFYLLQQPHTWQTLRDELLTVYPDPTSPPPLPVLERLPYLTAVIYESLRLSYGTASRIPRTARHPLPYGAYTIPAGTPMSMTHYSAHHDETLFPDSHAFVPERWLHGARAPRLTTFGAENDRENDHPLTRYLVSFTKGSRSCVGQHLAWADMCIALATVVRRCDIAMVGTSLDDVGFVRDMFVPQPRAGSAGLRVLVKSVE